MWKGATHLVLLKSDDELRSFTFSIKGILPKNLERWQDRPEASIQMPAGDKSLLPKLRRRILEIVFNNYTWVDHEQCGCFLVSCSDPQVAALYDLRTTPATEFDFSRWFSEPITERDLWMAGLPVTDSEHDSECEDGWWNSWLPSFPRYSNVDQFKQSSIEEWDGNLNIIVREALKKARLLTGADILSKTRKEIEALMGPASYFQLEGMLRIRNWSLRED
jgi:hypothetical protein